jgi:predicted lysophospholipase L1 biosynthesis ABC-type transport system permease subunit
MQAVSAEYLQTIRTPVRLGRPLSKNDQARSAPVAVVDEVFVRQYLSGLDSPIGKRIKIGSADASGSWLTIVGVVAASRQFSLDGPPEPHVYFPYSQLGGLAPVVGRGLYLVGRGSNPSSTLSALRRQVTELNPSMAVRDTGYLSDYVDTALEPQRVRTWLMVGFASLALFLAGVGLYGVVAFTVANRTQEIGVRIALGATSGKVVSMIVLDGARLAAVGLTLGVLANLALSTTIARQGLLFEVTPTDAPTLILAGIILAIVTLLASYLPGRGAASIDPMRALRRE